MFFDDDIKGDGLPPGTLCFTYDDGPGRTDGLATRPGPRTAELGRFLNAMNIPATFFAVGKFAEPFAGILGGLRALGHLVANHTFDHPSLPAFVAGGGDVYGQLARTDKAIHDHVEGGITFFRAPYGDWHLQDQARSNVAEALNRSDLKSKYLGPIGWDIDAGDVGFWRDERPADECARAYLEAIERVGRGIVLMHDSTADIDEIRQQNRALELARSLVPMLRRRGYRFVRLDRIPQVASAARVSFPLVLLGEDAGLVSTMPSGSDPIIDASLAVTTAAVFGVVDLGQNHWALRCANGFYLSPQPGGEVLANASTLTIREVLQVEDLGGRRIALRTVDGSYLNQSQGRVSRLSANARSIGMRESFIIGDACDGPH